MKKLPSYYVYLSLFLCCFFFVSAVNAQYSKTDEALKQLEAAGQVKRTGNVLEFKAEKPADTIQLRKKYENVFKTPNGSNYQLKFFIDPVYFQNIKKQAADRKTEDTYSKVENVLNKDRETADRATVYNNQSCFSNIAVFGDSRYREDYIKYKWQVPPDITKIKIEAWSGGGDGYSKKKDMDSLGNTVSFRSGSGGGGGAYAFVIIEVRPGDKIEMSIPGGGGGKNLVIQVNDILNSLLIANGSDGEPGNYAGKNGMGGFVTPQNIRGIFEGKTVWISGENGLFHKYHGTRTSAGVEFFGNGGAASKLNNGGRGAKWSSQDSDGISSSSYTNSTNGGFPGGGGGAGWNISIRQSPPTQNDSPEGQGAPGQVIIYY